MSTSLRTTKNHVLDLVITSSDTSLGPPVSFTHWSPSDHFAVFTRLSVNPAPLPPPTLHSFRRLHSIDVGSFPTDLKSSQLITDPPKSFGPLLSAYNTTLFSLFDKYAPIVTKLSRRQSPSNPWLRAFRSTLCHAENIWKRTRSAADWSSFKSLRNKYHKLTLYSKKCIIPASYLQPPITPNIFGEPQSINSYTANPPHRYLPLLLVLHLQTALLPFSQAKYPNCVSLTTNHATSPTHSPSPPATPPDF